MADQEAVGGSEAPRKENEFERLRRENATLKRELAQTKQAIVAEKGPQQGTAVCFQRMGEGFCRPATISSDGFTELLKAPGGATARHALIEYNEPPWTVSSGVPDHMKAHGFQTDKSWSPMGLPDTWHMPDECPRKGGPGCPFAPKPEWPPRRQEPQEAP